MGNRKIRIYPDTLERTIMLAKQAGLKEKKTVEVENAYLIVFILPDDQEHETVEYSSHTHPEHTR